LAITAPELSNRYTGAKRKVGKNQQVAQIKSFAYHDARMIRGYFTLKTMARVIHPVSLRNLSPRDFWFLGCAKERMEDQILANQDDLEDKLTEVWETASRDVLESGFHEWM
jgi:hypothetical protein